MSRSTGLTAGGDLVILFQLAQQPQLLALLISLGQMVSHRYLDYKPYELSLLNDFNSLDLGPLDAPLHLSQYTCKL